MKKDKHTKKVVAISIDRNLNESIAELFSNKSKYIEWLIYQDMLKNFPDDEKLKKIMI